MEARQKLGYDAPRAKQAEDSLDRWRFASELMGLIRNTPPEWSIRIGLTGKWGEGKSTVLHFIEGLARRDGHLVVWFVPWAATSLDELWAEFANRLLEAVGQAGIAAWKRAAAPFLGFRFHDLRHQAITEMAEAGVSDATLMAVSGHMSRRMLEHYSHVRMAAKRTVLDKLESGLMGGRVTGSPPSVEKPN